MMAGVTVVAWYPITPSSSLCESLIDYMGKYRVDADSGKATFAVVQAEDEIAALCSAIGASFGGALALTTTSGPGLTNAMTAAATAYAESQPLLVISPGMPTGTEGRDLGQLHEAKNTSAAMDQLGRIEARVAGLPDQKGKVACLEISQ